MGQEDVLVVVAVPVARQYGRYLVFGVGVAERLGVGDVLVLEDATVLGRLLTEDAEKNGAG